ncbi:Uncharacterized protein GNX_1309 [Leptospira interrogans serovar Canicola]|nr:Uncharacterized protein GNX_1309 [Leptospira interrogans serovar Canicola]
MVSCINSYLDATLFDEEYDKKSEKDRFRNKVYQENII